MLGVTKPAWKSRQLLTGAKGHGVASQGLCSASDTRAVRENISLSLITAVSYSAKCLVQEGKVCRLVPFE